LNYFGKVIYPTLGPTLHVLYVK